MVFARRYKTNGQETFGHTYTTLTHTHENSGGSLFLTSPIGVSPILIENILTRGLGKPCGVDRREGREVLAVQLRELKGMG